MNSWWGKKDNKNGHFLTVFCTKSVSSVPSFSVWNFKEIIISPLGYLRSSSGYKKSFNRIHIRMEVKLA